MALLPVSVEKKRRQKPVYYEEGYNNLHFLTSRWEYYIKLHLNNSWVNKKQPSDVSTLDRCHYPSSWVTQWENILFKLHLLFDESPSFSLFHSHISHTSAPLSLILLLLLLGSLSLSPPLCCPSSPFSLTCLIMASSSQSFCLYELTGDCVLADSVAVIHLDRLAASCVNSH